MIVVIADDLAGAAEMGGMAWRYGLAAEVVASLTARPPPWQEFAAGADVDLIAIDTDTRSCTAEEAARRVADVAARCRERGAMHPGEHVRGEHVRMDACVFKKVDSVLRGQVVAELAALLETWGKQRCLLVPANPGLGRVISGGQYYVHGKPLHETDFARDPEYPAATSDVVCRLAEGEGKKGKRGKGEGVGVWGCGGVGGCGWPVQVLRPGEAIPERGISVGEATSDADLAAWADALDESIMPAGASEFFAAFLRAKGLHEKAPPEAEFTRQTVERVAGFRGMELFVCGSTSSYSRSLCERCAAHGVPVLRMPPGLGEPIRVEIDSGAGVGTRRSAMPAFRRTPHLIQEWADAVVRALECHARAVVAIDRPLCADPADQSIRGMPQVLGGHLSAVVEQVLSRQPVDRLFVEGGATAAALVRQLGWERLRVCREWATGVVSMHAERVPPAGRARPLLTMKPGSYAWPDEILALLFVQGQASWTTATP